MTLEEFKHRRRDLMRIKTNGCGAGGISYDDLVQTNKFKRLTGIMKIEAADLKNLIAYNPETGEAVWKKRDELSPYWSQRAARRFNSTNAGKQVGSLRKLRDGTSQVCLRLPDGKTYLLHRVIWALVTNKWPEGMIAHVDGDKTNNRWANLQSTNQGELNRKARIRSDNTTGVKGVSWIESRGYFEVRTSADGVTKTKTTDTLEEAIKIKNDQLKSLGFAPLAGV